MNSGGPHTEDATAIEIRDAIRLLRIELGILNAKIAVEAGLHPRDLDVLDVIDRDGPCTPSHLAERTGLHRATLTGILARLETDGWIDRGRDAADGRSFQVRSTARFNELRHLYSPADAALGETLAKTTDAERTALIGLLAQLADRARNTSEQL